MVERMQCFSVLWRIRKLARLCPNRFHVLFDSTLRTKLADRKQNNYTAHELVSVNTLKDAGSCNTNAFVTYGEPAGRDSNLKSGVLRQHEDAADLWFAAARGRRNLPAPVYRCSPAQWLGIRRRLPVCYDHNAIRAWRIGWGRVLVS